MALRQRDVQGGGSPLPRLGDRVDNSLHPGRNHESYVVSEFTKSFLHAGEVPPLYHWRDHAGHEVDLVIDRGQWLDAWEMKSSETIRGDSFGGLAWWKDLVGERFGQGGIVYGGSRALTRKGFQVLGWDGC